LICSHSANLQKRYSPAAIAVAVIRDNARPEIPEHAASETNSEYLELMTAAWHQDPMIRPTFLEIMTRLSSMLDESATTSSSSTWASSKRTTRKPSSTGASSSTASSSEYNFGPEVLEIKVGAAKHLAGEITFVFSDIAQAASLWQLKPSSAMRDATSIHNETLRSLLTKHHGYELAFSHELNSSVGSFCLGFQNVNDALEWCMAVQQELLTKDWPEELLANPAASEEMSHNDVLVFRGLRVRMGIHVGTARLVVDPATHSVEFVGPNVNMAAQLAELAQAGQVLMTKTAYKQAATQKLVKAEPARIARLGTVQLEETVPQGSFLCHLSSIRIQ
jgi:class 3 adenylate cyclase